jgi:hypothetical protein
VLSLSVSSRIGAARDPDHRRDVAHARHLRDLPDEVVGERPAGDGTTERGDRLDSTSTSFVVTPTLRRASLQIR